MPPLSLGFLEPICKVSSDEPGCGSIKSFLSSSHIVSINMAHVPVSLAHLGRETFRLFQKVTGVSDAHRTRDEACLPKAQYEVQRDRFKIWAIDLGLVVPGHGSLDYRVREAESLANTFRVFLGDLNESLREGAIPSILLF